jgi:hypothetical protein
MENTIDCDNQKDEIKERNGLEKLGIENQI